MTQTINRMYGTRIQGMRAADELKARGFKDVHVFDGAKPIQPASDHEDPAASAPAPRSGASLLVEMRKAYILDSHARVYADRVSLGGTLVTVHALFGTALEATNVLDSFDPIDSGVPEPVFESYAWNEKIPLSSALQIKTLTKTKLPFETIWNVPSVTRKPTFFSKLLGFSLLTSSKTPFSSLLGLTLLSRDATPLSTQLGFPLLVKSGR